MTILSWLWRRMPEMPLKRKMRCLCYNLFKKDMLPFHCRYENDHYVLRHRTLGFTFKTYHNPFWNDDIYAVLEYVKHRLPRQGDIVIDAGAFVGHFTLFAALLVGKKGKVYAFEPDTVNYKHLVENIRLNGFANVTALNQGIWNSEGTLPFFEHPGKGFASTLLFDAAAEGKTVFVPVTSLDAFIKKTGLPAVHFIKMDIEGAELEALGGAAATLRGNNVFLAVASYHIVNGAPTHRRVEQQLAAYGYIPTTVKSRCQTTTYAHKEERP